MEALLSKRGNGRAKVITGLRRCGKSFLLKELYIPYLLKEGVKEENILLLELDDLGNAPFRNPLKLFEKILSSLHEGMNYVFLDEIQLCQEVENPDAPGDVLSFVDVANGLLKRKDVDLYLTGSNSRMLSSEILTRFRDRGDEVRVSPLSIGEIAEEAGGPSSSFFEEYLVYGGLPRVLLEKSPEGKAGYLRSVMEETYLKDIPARDASPSEKGFKNIGRILSTTAGSLTSIENISRTLTSAYKESFHWDKVRRFLDLFKGSFLIEEAERYDLVGRRNLEGPHKFYYSDNGLMSAFSDFSHFERQQALECAVYNHLRGTGYSVEVGVVPVRRMEGGERKMRSYEVNFVATKYLTKLYVQVACSLREASKERQEKASLSAIRDSNMKIVLVGEDIPPHRDEEGILSLPVLKFLLDGCRI